LSQEFTSSNSDHNEKAINDEILALSSMPDLITRNVQIFFYLKNDYNIWPEDVEKISFSGLKIPKRLNFC
jgi:hypothetical protein